MNEYKGWLLDVYTHSKRGVVVWLLLEDGRRLFFTHDFPVTFFASGPFPRLRELWRWIQRGEVKLSRTRGEDLYTGPLDLLQVDVLNPVDYTQLFRLVSAGFPDLTFYNADIPLPLRYAAAYRVFPLAHCKITALSSGKLISIIPLDKPEDLIPKLPPLRILHMSPDVDPSHAPPKNLLVRFRNYSYQLPLGEPREVLILLSAILSRFDPDILFTSFGDTWLFTYLEDLSKQVGFPFNPNRDTTRAILRRKAISFFNYGQAHYRGEQVHLFGRWHIDRQNCMTFPDYGIAGTIEQARLTGLPIQEVARRSPGAGIAAIQTLTAMKRGVLIPYQHQKGEVPKSFAQLFKADRGGLVFQPPPGIFPHVAILDFVSMYPSIMVKYNLSPEAVGSNEPEAWEIPGLEIKVSRRLGLVPEALAPVLGKRIALKKLLKNPRLDPLLRKHYKSLSRALKWLLVVAYGRLGYANSTFGRINSHEAVTHIGRMVLLKAKKIAEDQGFTILHMYVDSLFLTKPGATSPEDFQSLMDEIEVATRLPVDLDAVYPWMAFLPSRMKPNVPVANRFFGLLPGGEHKIRGLALRRHDTPPFVARAQMQALEILGTEVDPARLPSLLPEIIHLLRERLMLLKRNEIPMEELVVTQSLSRELEEYKVDTPLARAAGQLEASGKTLRMGQRVRFIYITGKEEVLAWDLPLNRFKFTVDTAKYQELLSRAAFEVVQPLGINQETLDGWLADKAGYLLPGDIAGLGFIASKRLPLFSNKNFDTD